MRLIDDFCTLESATGTPPEVDYRIRLHKDHPIFRAHFPGHPITPGVCIIQLCKELAERHTNTRLELIQASNIKFLSVIDPLRSDTVHIRLVLSSQDGAKSTFSAIVHREEVVFAKLHFTCTSSS
jgi:3-hydroxyacyl-[acyl-carrier-protein] dehydratase